MDALLPGLIQAAKNAAKEALPPGSMPPDVDDQMEEFTQSLLGGGEGGGGMGGLLSNLLGGLGGLGGLEGLGGPTTRPHDIRETVEVEFEDFFKSKEVTVKFVAKYLDEATASLRKKKKKVTVVLPAGAPESYEIRVANQGHYDTKTHMTGDLIIRFKTKASSMWAKYYRRSDRDLVLHLPIESFRRDSLQFDRMIPHPCGRPVRVTVPAEKLAKSPLGFHGHSEIRVPCMGYPSFKGNRPGDLVVRVYFSPEKMRYDGHDFIYTGESMMDLVPKLLGPGVAVVGAAIEDADVDPEDAEDVDDPEDPEHVEDAEDAEADSEAHKVEEVSE